jgi:tetratricopeptide (TPR) repeat protein
MVRLLCAALVAVAALGADLRYELSGHLVPQSTAVVSLYGVRDPYTASTRAGFNGRFRFRKLRPGAYTVVVYIPQRGVARMTTEVGPGTADARRRVELELKFEDADFEISDVMLRRHSISVKQARIPERAYREYNAALKELSKPDIEAAEERLRKAVEIAPQFSTAWNHLGTIAYQSKRYERAEECFREALEQDPKAFEPLVNLGGVLLTRRKIDEALTHNLDAVLMRPNDALANSQLGMTYFALGTLDLAAKYLAQASRLDPAHFSHPQLMLAEIQYRRGDPRAAADSLADFLKYHPDYPQAARLAAAIADLRKK